MQPYFHVIPKTGIQICRNVALTTLPTGVTAEALWKNAVAYARDQKFRNNPLVQLIRDHIACPSQIANTEITDWMSCDNTFGAFVRLKRNTNNSALTLDFVIDTNSPAGAQLRNEIQCHIGATGIARIGQLLGSKPLHVGGFYVLPPVDASGKEVSLIIDFGNTGIGIMLTT
ncbi:MAG: hypothetical protein ACRC10_00485 [Thermoguttaceae bacterium]